MSTKVTTSSRRAGVERPRDTTGPRLRGVPAVTRSIQILRFLARSPAPVSLKTVADELGLVPSTCLHILRVMAGEEFVKVDPQTKRYSLGVGILPLARSVLNGNGFRDVVQPALDQLSDVYGVTATGVEVTGLAHMVVVAISRSPLRLRLHVDVGSRFPSLISATGRCFAAFGGQPKSEIERRFKALRWDRAPPFETWRAEVEAVRDSGYSIDRGNYINGVTIMAVPILDSRRLMSHSLVAVGLHEQIRDDTIPAIAATMREAAAEVTSRLGTLS